MSRINDKSMIMTALVVVGVLLADAWGEYPVQRRLPDAKRGEL